ncbi:MAG: ATP-dependent helicase UvrD/PcrA [Actinomycetota bacterium]|nr:ATP-dependent helicase UvrD/PcrA [Actinomycetota bacterium]
MEANRLLDGLTEAQAAAVTSDGAPLVILAGAGSGKTRVLTRRIAWRIAEGAADGRHVLALTFTRKAAGELRARLGTLGVRDQVAAGTFHAMAYAQLRQRWADRGVEAPGLLDRKVPLIARLMGPSGRNATVQPVDLAGEIEWAKARLVVPDRYEDEVNRLGRTPPIAASAMAALYARYEDEKRSRRVVDFDDLLLLCGRALRDDPEFAARQRWRFRHLFVDEYQDVNPAQAALLEGWRGTGTDLCVVGDPNQAIYAWNGAEPTYLTRFVEREPGATVVRLDDSFRSTPQILAVAAAVLGDDATPLRAHQADGRLPTVRSHADERAESIAVARGLRDRRRPGSPWSALAVLARTNAQLVVLEEALRTAGVPYRVRGGSPFLDRLEVSEAITALRRRPGAFAERLAWLADSVREDDGDASAPMAAERRGNLNELVRLSEEYTAAGGVPTVEGFIGWLDATLRGDNGATPSDGVELATFHAAKGLEWPIVFLVGLERGLVPIGRAKTPEAEAEERRLLYVAVTRAESELHCSWARERTFGARSLKRAPSPWLDDVNTTLKALADGVRPADLRARIAEERRKLRSTDGGSGRSRTTVIVGADADPAVLDALKAWRRGAAKAAGVPAYVIFHDTTLAAVAEAQPTSREALLALPGLGPVKAARYGDDLLRVVAESIAS